MRVLVTYLLLCFSFHISAQEGARLNVYLDTSDLVIGQQIKVEVQLTSSSSDSVQFPILQDSLVDKVEILETTKIDTSFEGDDFTKVLSQTASVTSFDSGFYAIPPLVAIVNGDSVFSRPFLISVFTFQVDSTNAITDIKDIREVPLTFKDYLEAYWHYGVYGLIIILIGLAVWYYFKTRRETPQIVVKKEKAIPAHVLALQKLKQLEDENLWQNNQVKEYHVRLSETVRDYIERRYDIPALEQTTDEIMHHLRLTEITDDQKGTLRKFLMLSDLVKFAKEEPLPEENKDSMKFAVQFVEATKKLEIESTEEADSKHVER